SPSANPGTKPPHRPFASTTSKSASSCRSPLKLPPTYTALARGPQTRNVQPPGTRLAPKGVALLILSWEVGMGDSLEELSGKVQPTQSTFPIQGTDRIDSPCWLPIFCCRFPHLNRLVPT